MLESQLPQLQVQAVGSPTHWHAMHARLTLHSLSSQRCCPRSRNAGLLNSPPRGPSPGKPLLEGCQLSQGSARGPHTVRAHHKARPCGQVPEILFRWLTLYADGCQLPVWHMWRLMSHCHVQICGRKRGCTRLLQVPKGAHAAVQLQAAPLPSCSPPDVLAQLFVVHLHHAAVAGGLHLAPQHALGLRSEGARAACSGKKRAVGTHASSAAKGKGQGGGTHGGVCSRPPTTTHTNNGPPAGPQQQHH